MSGAFGRAGPFFHGTAASRAAMTAATSGLQDNDIFLETDTGKMYRCSDASGPVWVPFDPNAATVWHDTLSNLQGLGTDDGVAVGQTAIVSDKDYIRAVCATAAASSSTWTAYRSWFTTHAAQDRSASGDLRMAWNDVNARSSFNIYNATGVAPYDGYLHKVHLVNVHDTTAGATDVEFRKAAAGAAFPGSADETQSFTLAAADTAYEVTFAGSGADDNTFSKGDRLDISISPTGNHEDWTITAEWKVDLLT